MSDGFGFITWPVEQLVKNVFPNFDLNWALAISTCMFIALIFFITLALVQGAQLTRGSLVPFVNFLRPIVSKRSVENAREQFSERFEEIDATLSGRGKKRHPGLVTAWLEFSETLIQRQSTGAERPIYQNTLRPDVFFDRVVPNFRWLGIASNMFVGVGLLFTFIGLIAALTQFADALEAENIEMNTALGDFIGIASAKFVTSITGVFASLCLKLLEQLQIRKIARHRSEICRLLERGLQYLPPQGLADESLTVSKEQTGILKQMGETIAVQLSEKVKDAFQPLGETLKDIKTAVEDTGRDQAERIQNAVSSSVSEATGEELRRLADVLADVPKAMAGIDTKLENSGQKAASEIEAVAKMLNESFSNLPELIADASKKSAAGIETASQDATQALMKMLQETAAQSQHSTAQLASNLESTLSQMKELLASSSVHVTKTVENSSQHLENAGRSVTEKIDALFSRIDEAQEKRDRQDDERAERSRERMNLALAETVEKFDGVGESLGQGISGLSATLKEGAEQGAAAIATAAQEAAETIRQAASGASQDLTAAGARLAATTESFTRLESVANEFRDASTIAVTTLTSLSDRLNQANDAAIQSIKSLEHQSKSATESLSNINDSYAASARANQLMVDQLAQLANEIKKTQTSLEGAWNSYSGRFEDVDKMLGRAADHLSDQYTGFSEKFKEAISNLDSGLNGHLSTLHDTTSDLSEHVEALVDLMDRGNPNGSVET